MLQATSFDLLEPAVFQSPFGMIFTVIIALEFGRTLLLITERQQSIVRVRAVILIAGNRPQVDYSRSRRRW